MTRLLFVSILLLFIFQGTAQTVIICEDKNYARKLQLMLEQDTRITGVRIKPTTGSVVVTYKPETLSGFSKGELAIVFSELLGLIDSRATPETSSPLRAKIENVIARDGHLYQENVT